MFEKEVYIERRRKLMQSLGSGIALFLGNDESPMNYADNGYHFRQDSSFLYFFGIDFPGLIALIDVDNQKEMVFGDDFTIDDIVWMGPQPTIGQRADRAGVTVTQKLKKAHAIIQNESSKQRKIHILPPYRAEHRLKLFELLRVKPNELDANISMEFVRAVIAQREFKSSIELKEIEKAVDLSVDMHVGAMKFAKPGMTEAQVAARVYEIARSVNCELSFPIIATINGQTLHNHYHGNKLKKGDLFLLDAGAETQLHYAGDLSSTFPVDVSFTAQQKLIYEMSLMAHQAAVSELAPGAFFKNAHLAACRSIVESMKSIGLMKGNTEEALQEGAHALFLPCGTGHMMGLDVHDMENLGEVWVGYDGRAKSKQFGLKSLRLAKELKPGHVFTIEPGIYFIPELIDLWSSQSKFNEFIVWSEVNKFRNFGGIRNEEDYTITESGAQRIGKRKPMTIEEVEQIRNNSSN